MTEDEAKKKICHVMSRPNSEHYPKGIIFCQGSDCMAWQPYETATFTRRTGHTLKSNNGYCAKGANSITERFVSTPAIQGDLP